MQEQTHILGAYDTEVNTGQTSAWSYRYFTSNEWMNKLQSGPQDVLHNAVRASLTRKCAASLILNSRQFSQSGDLWR